MKQINRKEQKNFDILGPTTTEESNQEESKIHDEGYNQRARSEFQPQIGMNEDVKEQPNFGHMRRDNEYIHRPSFMLKSPSQNRIELQENELEDPQSDINRIMKQQEYLRQGQRRKIFEDQSL